MQEPASGPAHQPYPLLSSLFPSTLFPCFSSAAKPFVNTTVKATWAFLLETCISHHLFPPHSYVIVLPSGWASADTQGSVQFIIHAIPRMNFYNDLTINDKSDLTLYFWAFHGRLKYVRKFSAMAHKTLHSQVLIRIYDFISHHIPFTHQASTTSAFFLNLEHCKLILTLGPLNRPGLGWDKGGIHVGAHSQGSASAGFLHYFPLSGTPQMFAGLILYCCHL